MLDKVRYHKKIYKTMGGEQNMQVKDEPQDNLSKKNNISKIDSNNIDINEEEYKKRIEERKKREERIKEREERVKKREEKIKEKTKAISERNEQKKKS
jgi:hypothetical protein